MAIRQIHDVPAAPARPATFHKGLAGRVAIVAGSRDMCGAAVLCGWGALRGGAGLVYVCTAASAQPLVAAAEPCLMTRGLPEDAGGRIAGGSAELDRVLTDAGVLAVGPGLGRSAALDELLDRLVQTPAPLIIDADGLNSLADSRRAAARAERGGVTVLTPHPGEMNRLLAGLGEPPLAGETRDVRVAAALLVAARTRAVVVLKGHETVVADPDSYYVNSTGNPGMASGGMGDVLTGLIAALVAQGLPALAAAIRGVWQHGRAADLLARHYGPIGYIARDVADELPRVLLA